MPAPRSLWRSMLTVFQIVMLVAFSVMGAGHSHAGPASVAHAHTHAHVAASAHSEAVGAEHLGALSDRGERTGDDAAAGHCGFHCCHASAVRSDGYTVAVSWKPERRLAGLRAVAFDSVTPETLPEPPRIFA